MDTTLHPPPSDDEARWRAVAARDRRADGAFVYAVRSTGVYCRPSCPSRRPRRERVSFFAVPEAAEGAGFRPCRRCRPERAETADPRLAAVRHVCRLLASGGETMPRLDDLAKATGFSPHHLQRLFTAVVGVSPRAYGEALRSGRVKALLRNGDGVAGALYEAGYGSSSRLYEKAAAQLGMTPASYARGGRGARVSFTVAPCPLGRLLVAATAKGVAAVSLGDDDAALEARLRAELPAAEIGRDDAGLAAAVAAIVAHLEGHGPHPALPLDVRATAFRWQVWRALAAIPAGATRSYGEIAAAIGRPGAARAVGSACAANPVALVIPCHRAGGADAPPPPPPGPPPAPRGRPPRRRHRLPLGNRAQARVAGTRAQGAGADVSRPAASAPA